MCGGVQLVAKFLFAGGNLLGNVLAALGKQVNQAFIHAPDLRALMVVEAGFVAKFAQGCRKMVAVNLRESF